MFTVKAYSQQDPLWKNKKLGFNPQTTIGKMGCLLTDLAMVAAGFGFDETPATLNQKMVALGENVGFIGEKIVPAAIPRVLPGMIFRSFLRCPTTPAPMERIDAALADGWPVIVELEFRRTVDLLAELRLDKAHIARYSPRPQTLAARKYPDDVEPEEKERRRRALDDLQSEIVGEINARLLGQTVEVLVEGRDEKKGRWYGRTRTDKLVFFEDAVPSSSPCRAGEGSDWRGKPAQVRVTWAGPWSLIGEIVA